MTQTPFEIIEAAAIHAQNEYTWHCHTLRSLTGYGWDAFNHLREWKFAEARESVITSLKENKTPGQLADMRDETDRLIASAREVADEHGLDLLADLCRHLATTRAEVIAKLANVNGALNEVLALYKGLRIQAKDMLYDRLKSEPETAS